MLRQTNSSVSANSSVYWTYTQATKPCHLYTYRVAINNSYCNVTYEYEFTTTDDGIVFVGE
ncbi:unnamed protein product, partial [marine sediment metagenome]